MVIEKPLQGFLQVFGVWTAGLLVLWAVCAFLDWITGNL